MTRLRKSSRARRTVAALLAATFLAASCTSSDSDVQTAGTTSSSSSSSTSEPEPTSTGDASTTTAGSRGRTGGVEKDTTTTGAPDPSSTTSASASSGSPDSPSPAPDGAAPTPGPGAPPAPAPGPDPAPPPPPPAPAPTGPRPIGSFSVRLTRIATLSSPIAASTRAGTNDLYVAERRGRVQRVNAGGGKTQVLDIASLVGGTSSERGLLGIAFSLDGRWLFVSYTNGAGTSVLDMVRMNGDSPGVRHNLMTVGQPFSNHNGGDVKVGPNGDVFWALGDGGSAGDPQNNGQNTATHLGSILRIRPNGDGSYAIPGENPFRGSASQRQEIWLYGVRNPWRFTFDRANGDLWIGDVGQNNWEEIDRLAAPGIGRGANLGWRLREGTRAYGGAAPPGHVGPVHEYSHGGGNCSVTGGYVYRGSRIPALSGAYVYGDYCRSEILGLRLNGERGSLGASVRASSLVSFAEDAAGELYVLSFDGSMYRIDPR